MSSDVPLSSEGQRRAEALKTNLENKGITRIFSTNYIRTTSTARPLSESKGIRIETYNPGDTAFISRLKNIQKGKVLIVGHSNTVDDIVNKLTGQQLLTDLPDTSYGDMFIVKGKKLKRSKF
jgi:broad specificity phosphatase PhoE